MASPLWLERLRCELCRQKLPAGYVNRLVAELSDHFHDLTEEVSMSTEAIACSRLGVPEQVAEAAACEYRRCSVLNRRPLLAFSTFVLLPLPLLVAVWAAVILASSVAIDLLAPDPETSGLSKEITPFLTIVAHVLITAIVLAPATALAALYSWLARRTIKAQRWTIASCAILAAATAMVHHTMHVSDEPGKSTIMLGILFGGEIGVASISQVVQFAVPLGIGLLFLLRQAKRDRELTAAA